MNILITEDAKETREVLRNIIQISIDYSITIFEANNGEEALSIINSNHIDILLTDIMMPVMDGFELIRRIKNNEKTKNIFIAAITGLSGEEQVQKVFSCGADYYISKPIQKDDIIARLKLIYKLISKEEHEFPEISRDTFNPFQTSIMMNYYTIFTILQEDDLYQIIHHITSLYPSTNKIMLKDFITILLKSYDKVDTKFEGAFEIILESSATDIYLSCTQSSFINAIKLYDSSLPFNYEIKYMPNSITIKIPSKDNS